jgi:FkbM family methyltransferase
MTSVLMVKELEPYVKQSGIVRVQHGNYALSLDLANVHERRYLLKLTMNVRYPQSDIDSKIYQALVQPTDRVLDAGANIGFTVIEFLNLGVKKILAVEPVPEIFHRLAVLSNDMVSVENCAISSEPGELDIFISESHNQGNSLRTEFLKIFPKVYGDTVRRLKVKTQTIDELCQKYGSFDIWKLDIEGSECEALRGAAVSLSQTPPRLIIAELYKDFFDEFKQLVSASHPYTYQAFLTEDGYELLFWDMTSPKPENVYKTSPTYVFTNLPLVIN